jgi:hypothetical protein
MIKTVVIPQNNDLHLSIPNSYIGKEVEVLLYTKEELKEEIIPHTNNVSRFKGLLTQEEAEKYHQYLKQARNEWDRDI